MSELRNLGLQNITEETFNAQNARTWLDYFCHAEHDFATLYAWASRYTHGLEEDRKVENSTFRLFSVSKKSISILKLADPSQFNRALTNIKDETEPYRTWIKEDRLMHGNGPEDGLSLFNRAMAAHLNNEAGPYAPWVPKITRTRSLVLGNMPRHEFLGEPSGSEGPGIPSSERDLPTTKHWVVHPLRIFPRRIWDLYSNRVIPFDWLVGSNHSDMRDDNIVDAALPWGWRSRLVKYNSVQAAGLTIEPFAAISHSWVMAENRELVWTEINQYQWPVPFPKDASLDDLRVELLRMGLRYCWLDVLCLRQAYDPRVDLEALQVQTAKYYTRTSYAGIRWWVPVRRLQMEHEQWLVRKEQELRKSEHLRKLEWKVDVPTIGNIYHRAAQIVIYLNGLGRGLDWNWERDMQRNTRHWFRRAWTLQELGGKGPGDKTTFLGGTESKKTIEGITDDASQVSHLTDLGNCLSGLRHKVCTTSIAAIILGGAVSKKGIEGRRASRSITDDAAQVSRLANDAIQVARLTDLGNCLSELRHKVCTAGIAAIIEEMNKRHAANQTDKVCGMIYLLLASDYCGIPVYDEEEPTEALWHRCVQMLLAQVGQTRGNSTDVSDLLMLFPHPSSQHWYPSWKQLCHFPKTSIREPEAHNVSSEYSIELRLRDIKDSFPDPTMLRHCTIQRVTCSSGGSGETDDTWDYRVSWKSWSWLGPTIQGHDSREWVKLHLDKKIFVEPLPDGDYSLIGLKRFRKDVAIEGNRATQRSSRCLALLCKEPPNRNGWLGLIYLRKVAMVEATWRIPRRGKVRHPYFGPSGGGPWNRVVLL